MSPNRRFPVCLISVLTLVAISATVLAESAGAGAAGATPRRADYTITVTIPASNTGTGKVTAPGIDCPGDCTETYAQNTAVTLTPTADPGSTFDHWGGHCEGAESGSARTCTLNGTASVFASAIFVSNGPPPDVTTPETTITKAEKTVKTSKGKAKVKFEFKSSEDDSTFECRLDDKPFRSCTSPTELNAKLGKHTFEVVATDAAGNADPSPARVSFKVKSK